MAKYLSLIHIWPGFVKLQQLADVIYDPWIDQTPLRIYNPEQLADRISAEAADVVVVESDSVRGPVFAQGSRALICLLYTSRCV